MPAKAAKLMARMSFNSLAHRRTATLCWLILASLVFSSSSLLSQQEPGSESQYLFRLERLQRHADVCVLVRRDGQYHLESLQTEKVRIFEGTLAPEKLATLEQLLSRDEFLKLRQADIPTPLLADLDQLLVSTFRSKGWQNLRFWDEASRKPYKDLLDPLWEWLESVQKQKAKELTEEAARNNCLPPEKIEFHSRAKEDAPQSPAVSVSPQNNFVFRMVNRNIEMGKIENSCVIVLPSGAYHFRRSQRGLDSKQVRTTVFDGNLSQDAIGSLRQILDSDELRNRASETPPRERFTTSYFTYLWIPRGATVQTISVWRYVQGPVFGSTPGSLHSSIPTTIDDHGSAVVRPLHEWIKKNLPQHGEVVTHVPVNAQCLPEP